MELKSRLSTIHRQVYLLVYNVYKEVRAELGWTFLISLIFFYLVDAYVSQWGNSCPQESFKTSLTERSKDLLEKLKKCGIGQRPVIFVGHSMGGLVAKKMLLQVTFCNFFIK